MIIFGSPFRYYQGPNIIHEAAHLISPLGKKVLIITDEIILNILKDDIAKSFENSDCAYQVALFSGETTKAEVLRLAKLAKDSSCDIILGLGGGKAADTAKAVSIELAFPVVIVPTSAASDAPVSHIALLYKEDHSKDCVVSMNYSPHIIIVDSQIILNSPLRLFISGIGDAIATKFEADACQKSNALNFLKGKPPKTAKALADLCFKIIEEKAFLAIDCMKKKELSQDFEDVLEATTLLSGLGFENGGLAAAHAMSSGLTMIPATQKNTHGELVAFGTLVQFVLEKRDESFIQHMLSFFKKLGLPTTLAEIGIKEEHKEQVTDMCAKICTKPNIIFNMPEEISASELEKAIYLADKYGAW